MFLVLGFVLGCAGNLRVWAGGLGLGCVLCFVLGCWFGVFSGSFECVLCVLCCGSIFGKLARMCNLVSCVRVCPQPSCEVLTLLP